MNMTEDLLTIDTVADLDLLDGLRHAVCSICYPDYLPFGERFIACCGAEVVASGMLSYGPPPNACPACLPARLQPCPRHTEEP